MCVIFQILRIMFLRFDLEHHNSDQIQNIFIIHD